MPGEYTRDMYSFDQIIKGMAKPKMIAWELNRLYFSALNQSQFNDSGLDIFDEEWDTLVILDACRSDEFEKATPLPGTTHSRCSKASMTREWVRANFLDRDLRDTVYVTAINQIQHFPQERHPNLCDFLWPNDDSELISVGEMRTVPPEVITKHALRIHEKYPNKRIVIHYGQPHQPYIGNSSEKFKWDGGDFHQNIAGSNVSKEDVFEAYRETLEITLDEVRDLLNEIDGRIVVSADHGEMLGESQHPIPVRHYGHPNGMYVDELVQIPWHVYESGERRDIEAAAYEDLIESEQRELEQHLHDMGYV